MGRHQRAQIPCSERVSRKHIPERDEREIERRTGQLRDHHAAGQEHRRGDARARGVGDDLRHDRPQLPGLERKEDDLVGERHQGRTPCAGKPHDAGEKGYGLGRSIGSFLNALKPPHLPLSVLAAADRLDLPATVHVAIGTDIVHVHPSASAADIGKATHRDFRTFTSVVADLEGGGVYLNVGSAVIMPEVFLKAVTLVQNRGIKLRARLERGLASQQYPEAETRRRTLRS